jgi:hypothetical protein
LDDGSLEAVVLDDIDADGTREVIVIATYMTGIGPTGAEPFHSNAVVAWNGSVFVRLRSVEAKVSQLATAAKIRRTLKGMKDFRRPAPEPAYAQNCTFEPAARVPIEAVAASGPAGSPPGDSRAGGGEGARGLLRDSEDFARDTANVAKLGYRMQQNPYSAIGAVQSGEAQQAVDNLGRSAEQMQGHIDRGAQRVEAAGQTVRHLLHRGE